MGEDGPVEVDETFLGRDRLNPPMPGRQANINNMNKVLSLVVDDKERAEKAVSGVVGKRLTYRQPHGHKRHGLHAADTW